MSTSPSAPSLPLDPTRPSPFSTLPTELIQSIVESTVPLHYHSRTYPSRQSTLRSLCLVSKLFREIARPLLSAVVKLNSSRSFKSWKASRGGGGPPGREVIIAWSFSASRFTRRLDSVVFYCATLTLLAITTNDGPYEFDLGQLSGLHSLTTLRISASLLAPTTGLIFPKISELSLLRVYPVTALVDLLNFTTLPSLRLFSWEFINALTPYDGLRDIENITASIIPSLVTGLEVLSVDEGDFRHSSPDVLAKMNPQTLFDVWYKSILRTPGLKHVRVLLHNRESNSVYFRLQELAASIRDANAGSLPSLIYLPLQVSLLYHFSDLKTVCKKKEIELVFEDYSKSWESDPPISADFRRRIRGARL